MGHPVLILPEAGDTFDIFAAVSDHALAAVAQQDDIEAKWKAITCQIWHPPT
jgi:hypothetical protein